MPERTRLRRVLIVSPAFPPMSTPDLQRVRMSLPYFRQNGWEPVVLTVDAAVQTGAREEALLQTMPADVQVVRTGALPLSIARRVGLGNLGLRSWFALFRAGNRLLREGTFDLVYFSTTQFVVFILGRVWRRLHHVPYVIDLQDPWRTDYYERPGVRRPPGGWKYQFARAQAWAFEEWSFRRVSGFVSVSAQYLVELTRRYPWFARVPSEAIQFGASTTDIARAQSLPAPPLPPAPAGTVRLVYTGAAGPVTPHAVLLLFESLRAFRATHPEEARRLRLEFLGTSYGAGEQAQPTILPLAASFGVQDQILELPMRLGHLETLRAQADADVLLLLGSSDLAYSPSKVYPYFLSRRPILSLVFRNSVLESIVRELNCSYMVAFTESADHSAAVEALSRFFEELCRTGRAPQPGPRNEDLFEREYLAERLTARQTALFDRALEFSRSNAGS